MPKMFMRFDDNSQAVSRMGAFRLANRNSMLDMQYQQRNAQLIMQQGEQQLQQQQKLREQKLQQQKLQQRQQGVTDKKSAAIKKMMNVYEKKEGGGCGVCSGAK